MYFVVQERSKCREDLLLRYYYTELSRVTHSHSDLALDWSANVIRCPVFPPLSSVANRDQRTDIARSHRTVGGGTIKGPADRRRKFPAAGNSAVR